ncbi:S-adenosylhomocysteine deaminase [Anaerosporomusa subterranea]|uniref:S-adenosylhomocysteine deaminase n=1 Tax=Anaerosporomusa subterranea TaxID=1794912 RepID=A0A154BRT0_ANASB|nr:amidohydrolase [Anaerosporomusa subterranea]KYZ76228.1 S-adenosylhomocysteine deaminase [Anaerosporomusa subterranea]
MKRIYKPSYLLQSDQFVANAGVLVEAGMITEVGGIQELTSRQPDAEIIDWTGLAMLPGTVNSHNHSFQSLLRGLVVDRPFLEWRDQALYRYSPLLSEQDIYTGALFAFGEMMRYGVTTVCDFFYLHNQGIASDEAIIQAAKDTGIRLVLARTMYDWAGAPGGYRETIEQAVANTRQLAVKYDQNPMVKIIPAPHSLHAASLEMVKAGHKLALELGTRMHIHVAEEPFEVEETMQSHGLTPIELLHKIGVLDENMVAIHAVWLKAGEIQLMGKKSAKLAYCPSSNMFLADGVTKVIDLMKAGVVVGLGTDGACSNNRISIFEEMRMTALLQKVSLLNATAISAKQVFSMGTANGEELLGIPVGKIEPGYYADFVGVDTSDLSVQPLFSVNEQLLPNIVYSMQPNAIDRVVVNGIEQVQSSKLVSIREDDILNRLQTVAEKFNACK